MFAPEEIARDRFIVDNLCEFDRNWPTLVPEIFEDRRVMVLDVIRSVLEWHDTPSNGRDVGWVSRHADDAYLIERSSIGVQDAVDGFMDRWLQRSGGHRTLFQYSVRKLVHICAIVALAHSRGFDPEILRV